MPTTATTDNASRKHRRVRRGIVVTDGRSKTIKVVYHYTQKHPKYGKIMRRRSTMHAHDEKNEAKAGDLVEVMACRPLSKQKSWRLVRIVKRGPGAAD